MRSNEYGINKDQNLIHLTTSSTDPPSLHLHNRKIQRNLLGSSRNETHRQMDRMH